MCHFNVSIYSVLLFGESGCLYLFIVKENILYAYLNCHFNSTNNKNSIVHLYQNFWTRVRKCRNETFNHLLSSI